ncbi:APC family permease [Rhodovulum euryhalinum]|uniref:Amino acid/polyamine/organocation transporter (APC superfamily) n=1 Tax=Rhodovulum euryhalinum TaxID=35805 RepID=A0A4R2KPY8_9RHOB|nr:APC family permease [Rhodovulum euryhalinum]TCO72939.1 amino acid/polyamine/organocation transporter (APC superfamily) [Rhodovulum euryhalinum]
MTETLKRRIGLPLLTAYGIGVIVGAGIYVLVGAVAGVVGVWTPLAFLLAGLVAAPSALSYAELSARIPEAAGEAAYVEQGLGLHGLAVFAGLAIVVAGTVSAAAVLRGGTGYLVAATGLPFAPLLVALGAGLVLVAVVGVLESMAFAAVLTAVELIGLGLVLYAGVQAEPVADWPAPGPLPLAGMGLATVLAFYAFIGFEDMVNMAEEVADPARTVPRAIMLALAVTTLIYVVVSLVTVRAVPVADLAASDRPLALVWEKGVGGSAVFLSVIAGLAALNGVLAQVVMAARVLFGLGRGEPRLAAFHHAHPRFGTPVLGTLMVGGVVVATALALPVAALAGATSVVLLMVFALVNLSLIALKRRAPDAPFRVPVWVPWAGLVTALAALALSFGGIA